MANASIPGGRSIDWIVLPAIALVTVMGIVGLAEVTAGLAFPQQRAILASCFVLNDPVHGVRGKSGCTFDEAGRESESVVNPKTNLVSWGDQSTLSKIKSRIQTYFANETFQQAISDFLGRTRTAFAFRYFVYRSPSLYLKSYLSQVDSEEGFLRRNLSPEWLGHMQEVQKYSADISRKAHAANIPLVAVYVPNHAQAEMIAIGKWPPGYDPYQLDARLRSMMTAQGDIYLDILPAYRNLPVADIQQDFLPVDGLPMPVDKL